MHDINIIWYEWLCYEALHCRYPSHTLNANQCLFVSCLDSAALEVVYVTTDSIVLHFLVRYNRYSSTTFNINVDGLYWAQTMKTIYTISGLVSDREYIMTVDVIQYGRIQTTLHQSARTQKLGEYFTFHHSQYTIHRQWQHSLNTNYILSIYANLC